jgi:hypothetical protein
VEGVTRNISFFLPETPFMDQPTNKENVNATQSMGQLPPDVEHCTPAELRAIIADVRTPAHILDQIAQAHYQDEDILRDLVRCPNLDETTLAFIALTGSEEMKGFISATRGVDVVTGEGAEVKQQPGGEKKTLNTQQIILKMTPSQKIKLALTGAKEARGMLIREASKIIALSVLSNPRLTIGEIEFFAKSANLSEDVIRKIGTNTEWTRKNTVISALVSNPKTPVGVSLPFVNRLTDRELGILEKSRNIPEAVRTAARGRLIKRKMGK